MSEDVPYRLPPVEPLLSPARPFIGNDQRITLLLKRIEEQAEQIVRLRERVAILEDKLEGGSACLD